MTSPFFRHLSIRGKNLRRHFAVLSSLTLLLPALVISYVLDRANVLFTLETYQLIILALVVSLILAGLIILKKNFEELSSSATIIKKAAAGELCLMDATKNTAELNEIAVSFNTLIKRLEEAREEQAQLILLKKAFETTRTGITITDLDHKILYVNPADAKMHGYTCEDLIAEDARIFAPADLRGAESFGELMTMKTWMRERVNVRKDGSAFPVYLISDLIVNERGEPVGVVTTCDDITLFKHTLEGLRTTQDFLQAVVDCVPQPILVIDMNYHIILMNKAVCFRKQPLMCYKVIYDREEPCNDRPCPLEIIRDTGQQVTVVHEQKIGPETRFIEVYASPLFDADGSLEAIIKTSRDVTEQKKYEEHLEHLANHDLLTGLPNRQFFNSLLAETLARPEKRLLAVMFLDIDRFKVINDTLGHNIGDLLIQAVAHRLKGCVRTGDTIARLGGDEFLVLFPDLADIQDAAVLARKITRALSKAFILADHELHITVSIGISVYPADADDVASLIKNADTSMYCAKSLGRNNYQFYAPAMNAKGLEQLSLENGLRQALARKELLLHYQPQTDMKTGRIVGVEALLRWRHPERGMLPPTEFIALAEETGMIVPIGEWILHSACTQLKNWREAGSSIGRMSVNLSMRQFRQANLFETITAILKTTGLDPSLLELELTESIVMQNAEMTIRTLRELRSDGIHLTIDDFGTGFSSLSYLKYLPISKLKIAQCFIKGIAMDPNDEAISKAVIVLAHSLNLKVIAEGVETSGQLEFLRSFGCDEVQGYLLGRPLPAEEFTQALEEERHPAMQKLLDKQARDI